MRLVDLRQAPPVRKQEYFRPDQRQDIGGKRIKCCGVDAYTFTGFHVADIAHIQWISDDFIQNRISSKCVRTAVVVVPVAQKHRRKRVDDEWEHALRPRQALPLLQHLQHVIEVPRVQPVGAAKERAKYDGNECQDHLFFVTRSAPGALRSGLAKWL